MIATILFDLDGTLLPIDFDAFLGQYLAGFGRRLTRLVHPGRIRDLLSEATSTMLANHDGKVTLFEAFWEPLSRSIGRTPAEILAAIDEAEFYRNDVPVMRGDLPVQTAGRAVVEVAVRSGYEVVLATNPVFPRQVIEERMRWANLSDLPWALITSYEEMHFAKPNARYFAEVVARLGRSPLECVMVGNDTRDDLVAGTLGMKTFLLEGQIVDRENGLLPTWRGSFDMLATLIGQRFSAQDR